MDTSPNPAAASPPFPYEGPANLRQPLKDVLTRVGDPEIALLIVDVGLIYGMTVTVDKAQVRMTMTSAACPVADRMSEHARRFMRW